MKQVHFNEVHIKVAFAKTAFYHTDTRKKKKRFIHFRFDDFQLAVDLIAVPASQFVDDFQQINCLALFQQIEFLSVQESLTLKMLQLISFKCVGNRVMSLR